MNSSTILLLGSGNAATRIATELKKAGFQFSQIYSRTEEHAAALATPLNAPCHTSDIKKIRPDKADLVLSALKDSAAESVWKQLSFGDRPVFHTAGSMPLDALKPYAKRRGVLYPLQTLSKSRALDFRRVPLFIEAESPETLRILRSLAEVLSDQVSEADSEQRKALHLAAVFACNFTNHLYALADELLKENRLSFQVLLPLIDETARKVHELPPAAAQTGPAVRYDENIIQDHINRLKAHPDMREIYGILSRSIHRMAENRPENTPERIR